MRIGVLAVIILVMLSGDAFATDKVDQVREFVVEPATLECLGFRWYLYGDDNGNATITMRYRTAGDAEWRTALPLLRVNREVVNWDFEPYACENLLAGSILSLQPGTKYEVQCSLRDPEGGAADTTVVVSTRAVPEAPKPLRTLHVWPDSVPKGKDGFSRLASVEKLLRPGDEVFIHGGVHKLAPGGLVVRTSGTERNPIVFRAAGDGDAILDGGGLENMIDIRDAGHLFFEDLHVRGGNFAFRADGSYHLVIRRCIISDVVMGIYSYSELSREWYVADNVITGRNKAWYPRTEKNPSHTGAKIYGKGLVFCRNRVSGFWDCLAIANYGSPHRDIHLKCTAIDFYDNDLSEAVDDCIEADYGCHNIRFYRNRLRNSHTGLSAQPTYGGPIYFLRNEVWNATALPLKLHNWCTGLVIYHNTLICPRAAFRSYARWQNAILRNNLFLGVSGYAMETGSPHPKTTLDYNGYRTADPERFIKWFDGVSEQRYPTLEAFSEVTGHEGHGVMVDFDIFTLAAPPEEGKTYAGNEYDLTLRPVSAAVDAGVDLPTVNEDHAGSAPDLGCYEQRKPVPKYGPAEAPISGKGRGK
ncbi:MAG: right-handed parallel beta-helix repeat-containing protein [Candidatus Latescibacterota bacterium]